MPQGITISAFLASDNASISHSPRITLAILRAAPFRVQLCGWVVDSKDLITQIEKEVAADERQRLAGGLAHRGPRVLGRGVNLEQPHYCLKEAISRGLIDGNTVVLT